MKRSNEWNLMEHFAKKSNFYLIDFCHFSAKHRKSTEKMTHWKKNSCQWTSLLLSACAWCMTWRVNFVRSKDVQKQLGWMSLICKKSLYLTIDQARGFLNLQVQLFWLCWLRASSSLHNRYIYIQLDQIRNDVQVCIFVCRVCFSLHKTCFCSFPTTVAPLQVQRILSKWVRKYHTLICMSEEETLSAITFAVKI